MIRQFNLVIEFLSGSTRVAGANLADVGRFYVQDSTQLFTNRRSRAM